jgi:hypothetical protein
VEEARDSLPGNGFKPAHDVAELEAKYPQPADIDAIPEAESPGQRRRSSHRIAINNGKIRSGRTCAPHGKIQLYMNLKGQRGPRTGSR